MKLTENYEKNLQMIEQKMRLDKSFDGNVDFYPLAALCF